MSKSLDQNGNLLTGKESRGDGERMEDQYAYTSRVEERLTRRVASLIAPIVGEGRYRAEVSADHRYGAATGLSKRLHPFQQSD